MSRHNLGGEGAQWLWSQMQAPSALARLALDQAAAAPPRCGVPEALVLSTSPSEELHDTGMVAQAFVWLALNPRSYGLGTAPCWPTAPGPLACRCRPFAAPTPWPSRRGQHTDPPPGSPAAGPAPAGQQTCDVMSYRVPLWQEHPADGPKAGGPQTPCHPAVVKCIATCANAKRLHTCPPARRRCWPGFGAPPLRAGCLHDSGSALRHWLRP